MEIGQKPRKRDRFLHPFKKERPSPSSPLLSPQRSPKPSPSPSQISLVDQYSVSITESVGDTERTRLRYVEAVKLLDDAVKGSPWGFFGFPELKGEPQEFDDPEFREKINFAMEARKSSVDNLTAWWKCKDAVGHFCKSFSPFAKNFLAVTKDASAVKYYFLFAC